MTVWYRLNTITRCRNSRSLFHNYVTLQENNYQLHSKNYALKIIAKGENKIKDCLVYSARRPLAAPLYSLPC
jgi:hypothetical protein